MTKGKNIFHKEQPAADSSKPDRFLHVAIRAGRFMVDAVTQTAGMAHGGVCLPGPTLRQAIMECGPGPSAWGHHHTLGQALRDRDVRAANPAAVVHCCTRTDFDARSPAARLRPKTPCTLWAIVRLAPGSNFILCCRLDIY